MVFHCIHATPGVISPPKPPSRSASAGRLSDHFGRLSAVGLQAYAALVLRPGVQWILGHPVIPTRRTVGGDPEKARSVQLVNINIWEISIFHGILG